MIVRDETIQKLNSEIGKLKAKHQDKLTEIQKQTETIKKLQDALTNSHIDLDKTRKQSEEEVSSYLPCQQSMHENKLCSMRFHST